MSHDNDAPTEYRGSRIHPALGEGLQTALGLNERPEAFGDWVDAMASIAERDDLPVDVDLLCTTDESDHVAEFDGETHHFRCALDALIVPFLVDGVDRIDVTLTTPIRHEDVHLTVTEAGIEADPSDAVVSLGVARGVDGPAEDVASPLLAYSRFCPYGNAFVSRDEYHEWAADVDAETMAITTEGAHRLAAAIGRIADDLDR